MACASVCASPSAPEDRDGCEDVVAILEDEVGKELRMALPRVIPAAVLKASGGEGARGLAPHH